ncbi:hypothetical protein KAJ02_01435, partial [Candidatus Bipolaricaulota bacterium]|nr:hypothetical protein [Candidatus Bipolaricaulota bacterium]
ECELSTNTRAELLVCEPDSYHGIRFVAELLYSYSGFSPAKSSIRPSVSGETGETLSKYSASTSESSQPYVSCELGLEI